MGRRAFLSIKANNSIKGLPVYPESCIPPFKCPLSVPQVSSEYQIVGSVPWEASGTQSSVSFESTLLCIKTRGRASTPRAHLRPTPPFLLQGSLCGLWKPNFTSAPHPDLEKTITWDAAPLRSIITWTFPCRACASVHRCTHNTRRAGGSPTRFQDPAMVSGVTDPWHGGTGFAINRCNESTGDGLSYFSNSNTLLTTPMNESCRSNLTQNGPSLKNCLSIKLHTCSPLKCHPNVVPNLENIRKAAPWKVLYTVPWPPQVRLNLTLCFFSSLVLRSI